MPDLALTPDGLSRAAARTRHSVEVIGAALADSQRRALADAALAVAAALLERAPDRAAAPLDADARAALAGIGIDDPSPLSEAERLASVPVAAGLARSAEVLATALPLAEAARHLDVDPSRLRQRIKAGTLVAIPRPRGRGWLVPAFQLTRTGELPHLPRLLRALPGPTAAERLDAAFRLPDPETGDLPPRDWLIAGGDPAPVARLLAGL